MFKISHATFYRYVAPTANRTAADNAVAREQNTERYR